MTNCKISWRVTKKGSKTIIVKYQPLSYWVRSDQSPIIIFKRVYLIGRCLIQMISPSVIIIYLLLRRGFFLMSKNNEQIRGMKASRRRSRHPEKGRLRTGCKVNWKSRNHQGRVTGLTSKIIRSLLIVWGRKDNKWLVWASENQ